MQRGADVSDSTGRWGRRERTSFDCSNFQRRTSGPFISNWQHFHIFFQKIKIESNLEGARAVCSNWGVASAKSFSATWSCSGGRGQHFDSFHSLISLKRLRPAHAKTNNWKQRRHADTRTTNSAISGYYWIFFFTIDSSRCAAHWHTLHVWKRALRCTKRGHKWRAGGCNYLQNVSIGLQLLLFTTSGVDQVKVINQRPPSPRLWNTAIKLFVR